MNVLYHFVPEMPLRVSALRSLGAHLNVFTIESTLDDLARAGGVDPLAFRLAHMEDERARAVMIEAAGRFGWSHRPGRMGGAAAAWPSRATRISAPIARSSWKSRSRGDRRDHGPPG
jgi:CO/xanthine dehydrogenase Mo-binding subunit